MMKSFKLAVALVLGILLVSCGNHGKPSATENGTAQGYDAPSRPDCVLLDRPDTLKVIFYPRHNPIPEHTDPFDVFFPVADGVRLGGRLHVDKNESPVILLFHGNGEIASDYDHYSALYRQMGISVLVVDYRGYGKSDGTPTASNLLDDASAVYRQVRGVLSERGIDSSRLFIMGRSLGSAAALEVASDAGDAIKGLIIDSGFASAHIFIKEPLTDEMKEGVSGFDNAEKIKKVHVPTLIIHGEIDTIVPLEDAKRLFENCGSEQKRLVVIPEAGHNDLILRGETLYFSAIEKLVFG